MASDDDDSALSLPQPPLPAPARREAALSEALRRFDAEGDAPPVAAPRPVPQRARANRPLWSALVAASLVAMIGLPVAWLTVGEKTAPEPELASRKRVDPRTFDVAEEAPPVEVSIDRSEERTSKAAAAPAQALERRADNLADVRSQTVLAQALAAPPAIVATAPPPPAIMQAAPATAKSTQAVAAAETYDSVVVTSARSRGRAVPDRGDWNACTINDPEQSLAACAYLINPGAKGIKGQAAAHLADGLTLAWQGNTDRAIAAFDKAIAAAPKSPLAYLNRGLAYERQGDADRALDDLDRAVRLAPDVARGYYNRSLVLRARGDARRADADQARAVNLDADYAALISR